MKYLHRHIPGPEILNNFDHKLHDWSSLTSNDKKEIWIELIKMQGKTCAYCERKIDLHKLGDKHIEHFKRKGIYKELTFDWMNLFGSCGEKNRCGFFKDKQNYDEAHLLKADETDPNDFFHFSLTGDVVPRPNLSPNNELIAVETLRVFNLNPSNGGVKSERASSLSKGLKTIREYVGMAQSLIDSGEKAEDVREYIREEYFSLIKSHEFFTAHRHVFETFLP
ncbi:retron Ec78 anti-phage system effector HNH endonuclease PtuB [Pectobacterium polaris]|uniref:retron Ec78 anti-phage system effector HNH endonuclease PtuB n=1 Tax=Pectobacterium polaris TaxID=2042057 RepID=UPI001968F526|nr:retron Ec78 anti-phage system effector HNH endonuclease PtuB [Pectobacterium polaris]MBN3214581.1 TIGR02646 family protein [Pectobacterium polaris]